MQIIISHINTDFDALASMFAAKKLYPNAQVVISDKQNIPVSQFMAIYRDALDLVPDKSINWSDVTELILVDVASLSRIGNYTDQLERENLKIIIYDHHPYKSDDVESDYGVIESVGAAVTLLIEKIRERSIEITPFEATLFGLGVYTDTGSFHYNNTDARDLQAASYLMEQGMNLEMVHRFSDEILLPEQQDILNHLFHEAVTYEIAGLQIVVSSYHQTTFQKGLATLTQKLLEITDADAVLIVVGMKNRIYLVGRASSERISLPPLLKKWKGGGHEQAGSATIKNGNLGDIFKEMISSLSLIIKPAITARDMMTSPVKTIPPKTSIEESGQLMYRYGHTGFPVVQDGQLLGIITRRDLEKANHHGLGHAPVKAYMTTNIVSIHPDTTEEEIHKIIIEHNIGRLPVVEDDKLIGIVSRTNIIEMSHNQKEQEKLDISNEEGIKDHLKFEMKNQLPKEIYSLLKEISEIANNSNDPVYLIGGIVRDLFLDVPNDDIDLVVEGDGIDFAKILQNTSGGKLIIHESFGTATWTHPSGLEIDVTTSRLEFYDRPAALPDVETSTLSEDLYRRDFTINAMAIYLNKDSFGQLVDPFRGQLDLLKKKIKILHNLSFIEDPTRILRGVRFETRFEFLMDEQTEKLALHSIERVKDLSVNRIVHELEKLFSERDPERSIQRLFELQFWKQFGVSDERVHFSLEYAKQLNELYLLNILSQELNWFLYFIIPFYEDGVLENAKKFALTKKDMKFLKELQSLNKSLQLQNAKKVGELQRILKEYSSETILFYILKEKFENEDLLIQYIQKRENMPTLLTGEDLIQQGLKPGTYFSKILLDLEVSVLNEEVMTRDEAFQWLDKHQDKLDH